MRDCSMLREGSRQDSTGRPQKSTALTAWLLTTPMGKVDLRWPMLCEPVTMCTVQRNKSWPIFKSWYFVEIMLYFPYKNSFLNCLFFKKGKDSSCKFNLQFFGGAVCLCICFYLIIPKLADTCSSLLFCTGWVGMGYVNSIDPFPQRNRCHERRLSFFKRSQLHIFLDFKNKRIWWLLLMYCDKNTEICRASIRMERLEEIVCSFSIRLAYSPYETIWCGTLEVVLLNS